MLENIALYEGNRSTTAIKYDFENQLECEMRSHTHTHTHTHTHRVLIRSIRQQSLIVVGTGAFDEEKQLKL